MRILLVEDEPDLLAGLHRALRKAGYAVDTATDGTDGLHKALTIEYDAILLDVMLPEIDGWEILRRVRARRPTPVMMLTARDTPAERVRGLDNGADDYLVKPFDLSELLARLRALIRRTAGFAQPVVVIGPIRIDPAARTVTLNDTEVGITAREFAILAYLAHHRGRVISRTQLHEHVTDDLDDTLSNPIDVHVFNLRRKLGSDTIETRRGHGYVIP